MFESLVGPTWYLFALLLVTGCDGWVYIPTPNPETNNFEETVAFMQRQGGEVLVVVEHGRLVFEAYLNGYAPSAPHALLSGSKSLSGLLALLAVTDGLLTLDEPVANTITEWRDRQYAEEATIRQLLTMTSGLQPGSLTEDYTFTEALDFAFTDPLGASFKYGPVPLQVFGELMHRKLGGQDPTAYLQERLLDSLGVTVHWERINGFPELAGGASVTGRALARIGLLLLQHGRWKDKTLIAPELIHELHTGTMAMPAYGLTFWINAPLPPDFEVPVDYPEYLPPVGPGGFFSEEAPNDLYMAIGAAHQRLYLFPSDDLVVVHFGMPDPGWKDTPFLRALFNDLERANGVGWPAYTARSSSEPAS